MASATSSLRQLDAEDDQVVVGSRRARHRPTGDEPIGAHDEPGGFGLSDPLRARRRLEAALADQGFDCRSEPLVTTRARGASERKRWSVPV